MNNWIEDLSVIEYASENLHKLINIYGETVPLYLLYRAEIDSIDLQWNWKEDNLKGYCQQIGDRIETLVYHPIYREDYLTPKDWWGKPITDSLPF